MATVKTKSKKFHFKAEVKQLLDILVHSLYTSRDIFLRELISNSSDALDKLRFESNKGTKIIDNDLPLEIKITFDEKKKILTIEDGGIGMTKDEIISNIGTIAKSGSAEFLKQLTDSKQDANNIIGKFGVGFYSVFMIAKEVIIKTKSYKKDEPAIMWKSDGLGDYVISELDEKIKRGTTIEIHLKDDAEEFAEKYRLESIIKKYSNFIQFPILLEKEKVNTVSAIWREPKTSLTKEQYAEFYKYLSFDSEEPFEIIHTSVDAPIQFSALLFIPPKTNEWYKYNREDYGLDLYVRRVLIQHKNKDLLPEYLSFIVGVVDSEDLPLNISRETLQEDIIFNKISSSVTSQVLSYLQKIAKDDKEQFAKFWKEHGQIFKLGYMDFANADKYKSLSRFNSSASKDTDELVSLDEYVERMKKDQKEIYYAFGPSRDALKIDPHLELFKSKGIEVLYLYDPVDEFVINALGKYKDFDLKSVENTDPTKLKQMDSVEEKKKETEKLSSDDQLHFDSLVAKMKEILGDRVEDVKESSRLTDSPSCIVAKEEGMSASMLKMMKMANQQVGEQKKIFEVNKDHKLLRNLLTVFKKSSADDYITNVTEQLYESALLLEGSLDDPHKLVNRLNNMLEESSDWYVKVKKY
ncbi:MAG: molecular chaperone HtpG [Ignavibacteriae bacterium]|nr:MAG: molecular chaperone HtpG [Ignavibacteriota bacterium]